MTSALGDEFDFRIVTSDRDMLDTRPYPDIRTDVWLRVGKSWVYYASPGKRGVFHWRGLMDQCPHHILYLNSLFDPTFTLKALVARRMSKNPDCSVILAPRGELSPGALGLKRWKKEPFLRAARLGGFYDDIVWHASTENEASLIRRTFKEVREIVVAKNLLAPTTPYEIALRENTTGQLRVVFLSRIARKKNLLYALNVLSRSSIPIRFDIWGTIEDAAYWRACERMLKTMPPHVETDYRGAAKHDEVRRILSNYDLFFLPTLGENFGHAIAESLSVGTPALISNQTPWRGLEGHGVGWDLPLTEDGNVFLRAIEAAQKRKLSHGEDWRRSVRAFAELNFSDPGPLEANRRLLALAMQRSPGSRTI